MTRLPRIADLFTLANLSCGFSAMVAMVHESPTLACVLVLLAAVFDVFDGLVARVTGGGSPLGAQLDSLADMVSFGAAPAFMVHYTFVSHVEDEISSAWLLAPALLIVCASAWRLAKFNIDTRQVSGFIGLPTPANALFWVSLVAISAEFGVPGAGKDLPSLILDFFQRFEVLLITAIVMGFLMVSELRLPSIKFQNTSWKGNEVRFLLLIVGATLAISWQAMAVPLILILYLLSPLWGRAFSRTT